MSSLSEAARRLLAGTLEGLNDWKRSGYGGPCPPVRRHRYCYRLYALDTVLPILGRPSKAKLEPQIKGHVIAQPELVGTHRERG